MAEDKDLLEDYIDEIGDDNTEYDDQKASGIHLTLRYSYECLDGTYSAIGSPNTDEEKAWMDEKVALFNSIIDMDKDILLYAMAIFHDMDPKKRARADGHTNESSLHMHIILKYKDKHTQRLGRLRQLFNVSSKPGNIERIKGMRNMVLYLTHVTDKSMGDGKWRYSPDEVITYNCDYRYLCTYEAHKASKGLKRKSKEETREIEEDIATRIINGELAGKDAMPELVERIGNHVDSLKKRSFIENARKYRAEMVLADLRANGRDFMQIYVTGNGGIGKTTFSSYLLNQRYPNNFFTATTPGQGKTADILDGYIDEQAILLNEISANNYGLNEYLDFYDRNTISPVSSRGENINNIAETIIVNSANSPTKLWRELLQYSKGGKQYMKPGALNTLNDESETQNLYWQVKRRTDSVIVLLRDKVDFTQVNGYVFNLSKTDLKGDTGWHYLVGTFSYTSLPNTKPEFNDDMASKVWTLVNAEVDFNAPVTLLEDFLEAHDMHDKATEEKGTLEEFYDDVAPKFTWDFLPNEYIYDLYYAWMKRYYPGEQKEGKTRLLKAFELLAVEDGWQRLPYPIKPGERMRKAEVMSVEFSLNNWIAYHTGTFDLAVQRAYVPSYLLDKSMRGFIRPSDYDSVVDMYASKPEYENYKAYQYKKLDE